MIINRLQSESLIQDLLELASPGTSTTAVLIVRLATMEFVSKDQLRKTDHQVLTLRHCFPHCSLPVPHWQRAGDTLFEHIAAVNSLRQLPICLKEKYEGVGYVPQGSIT